MNIDPNIKFIIRNYAACPEVIKNLTQEERSALNAALNSIKNNKEPDQDAISKLKSRLSNPTSNPRTTNIFYKIARAIGNFFHLRISSGNLQKQLQELAPECSVDMDNITGLMFLNLNNENLKANVENLNKLITDKSITNEQLNKLFKELNFENTDRVFHGDKSKKIVGTYDLLIKERPFFINFFNKQTSNTPALSQQALNAISALQKHLYSLSHIHKAHIEFELNGTTYKSYLKDNILFIIEKGTNWEKNQFTIDVTNPNAKSMRIPKENWSLNKNWENCLLEAAKNIPTSNSDSSIFSAYTKIYDHFVKLGNKTSFDFKLDDKQFRLGWSSELKLPYIQSLDANGMFEIGKWIRLDGPNEFSCPSQSYNANTLPPEWVGPIKAAAEAIEKLKG